MDKNHIVVNKFSKSILFLPVWMYADAEFIRKSFANLDSVPINPSTERSRKFNDWILITLDMPRVAIVETGNLQLYWNNLVTVIHCVLFYWLDGTSCPALVLPSDSDRPYHNQAVHLYSIAHTKTLCFPLLAKVLAHPLSASHPQILCSLLHKNQATIEP